MFTTDFPTDLPAGFNNVVRLFPLPDLVMFPHSVQPLHIFEQRYRAMLADAIAGDGLIAMALLLPGWEAESQPPVGRVACVGRIVAHTQLEDGRSNIMLHGLSRAEVTSELPSDQPWREAKIQLWEDLYTSAGGELRDALRRDLTESLQSLIVDSNVGASKLLDHLKQTPTHQIPLGRLTDIIASSVGFDLEFKRILLEQRDVDTRATLLLQRLQRMAQQKQLQDFPPSFSAN